MIWVQSHKLPLLECITAPPPSTTLSVNVWEYYKNLKLADPSFSFNIPGKINFLFGADLFPDIFYGGQKRAKKGIPLPPYHTIFDCILLGKTITKSNAYVTRSHLTLSPTQALESSIKKFWKLEEILQKYNPTPGEVFCENTLKSITSEIHLVAIQWDTLFKDALYFIKSL